MGPVFHSGTRVKGLWKPPNLQAQHAKEMSLFCLCPAGLLGPRAGIRPLGTPTVFSCFPTTSGMEHCLSSPNSDSLGSPAS